MIEIKAHAIENNKTHIICNANGTREEIVNETLAVISALVGDYAKNDPVIHMLILLGLSEHPEVICGEDKDLLSAIRRKG